MSSEEKGTDLGVDEVGPLGVADARLTVRDRLDVDVGRQVEGEEDGVELGERAPKGVSDLCAHNKQPMSECR